MSYIVLENSDEPAGRKTGPSICCTSDLNSPIIKFLAGTRTRAEFGGTVTEVSVAVGDVIQAGDLIAVVD